jgi:hypothetical protein
MYASMTADEIHAAYLAYDLAHGATIPTDT